MVLKTKTKDAANSELYCFLDREADVLYLSQGKPSAQDTVTEQSPDLLLRTNTRTDRVRGITVLNFSKRQSATPLPLKLPVRAEWIAV